MKENHFENLGSVERELPIKPEKIEKILVNEPEKIKTEANRKKGVEKKEELEELRTTRKRLEEIKSEKVLPEENKKLPRDEEIRAYQENYLPSYLREPQEKETLIGRSVAFLAKLFKKFEIPPEEKENLPEKGPFLVISNHFGGETPALFELLKDYDSHIIAGEEFNWKRSSFRRWLLQKMRMISVEESLAHFSPEEKDELLRRMPGKSRKEACSRIIKREQEGQIPKNINFIRQSAALLSRGDVVAIYPEGVFLYKEERQLQQGYRGVELVAREYKRITGQELPIVPVAIFKEGEKKRKTKRVRIGKPVLLSDNKTKLSGTDWCMTNLAKLLPEEQRGYYKEESEK